ncbi:hypothetical protein CWI42_010530 [Ordospora colligata]|uniref:Uncharacterized protein n=1 Tax=Ordospora colligata OC4 TaxID=1354746 RepID=A0A0B2UH58_9MICR|nr:uncharacterized protein M896_010530 [Ordospora colligata OC4]KHN70401.1 hypothetical protein M896_010530 [Ordospora colligata OC4]TBU17151.1 hypothetical protein CWI41_010530 [Ordospora colligata]TBU19581.1 hypothetical protein CWI42_010530 [Ordospora colligata]
MEDIESIKDVCMAQKSKCVYFKGYLEHAIQASRRASEILFRVIQIPRDIQWNDALLTQCVEMCEKQQVVLDDFCALCGNTVMKELEELVSRIDSGIRSIEEEMQMVYEKSVESLKKLREAKDKHVDAWVSGKHDPWITESELRIAIKKVLISDNEACSAIRMKMDRFNALLQDVSGEFRSLVTRFAQKQKQMYTDLASITYIDLDMHTSVEKFFDAKSDLIQEVKLENNNNLKINDKIEDSFETLIEGMSKELSVRNIVVRKSIAVVNASLCKIKKGYSGDWMQAYMVVTSTKHVHFLEVYALIEEFMHEKDKRKLLLCINQLEDASISECERAVFEINDVMSKELARCRLNPVISLKSCENVYELVKEKKTIMINRKRQSGFASFFGICELKVRFFTLSSALEMDHALNTNAEVLVEDDIYTASDLKIEEECLNVDVHNEVEFRILLKEENPWVRDVN